MTLNKIFLLYFSIVFNIFSDSDGKVKFIVKVQDVVDGKNLNNIFSKEISIEKDKLNKDIKCEELIELLGIYNDEELKKYNISSLNYFVNFVNGYCLCFKDDIIEKILFSTKADKVIHFRPKARYNFDILDRYIMKDNFVLEKRKNKITKENYIKICKKIKEILNSDNCCFFLNLELSIWLHNILIEEKYSIFNDYFFIKDSKVFYPLNVTLIDCNNRKYELKYYFVTKNLYFLIKDFMNSMELRKSKRKLEYKDIKYIKDKENTIFDFEEELKNNNSQIDEKLKEIKLNSDSKIQVFIKHEFTEEEKDKDTKEEEKERKEDKKLTYCQRVKC